MAAPVLNQKAVFAVSHKARYLALKVAALTLFSLGLGFAHAWAVPRTYGLDRTAGFGMGMLHGAVMPAALPTLVVAKDVPIYATNNVGRGYKIGFILGLNTCGTLFFGLAFWKPEKR
jgi:hypothetical protein